MVQKARELLQLTKSNNLISSEISHCGAEYHARTEPANITSPGYPDNYPDSVDCATTIFADQGQVIELDFEFLEIEDDSTCRYDYLEVLFY